MLNLSMWYKDSDSLKIFLIQLLDERYKNISEFIVESSIEWNKLLRCPILKLKFPDYVKYKLHNQRMRFSWKGSIHEAIISQTREVVYDY